MVIVQQFESVLHFLPLSPRSLLLNNNVPLTPTHRCEKFMSCLKGEGVRTGASEDRWMVSPW
jgi:hypothetical protein